MKTPSRFIHRRPSESAFSLVELTIAILIIGLLIGGTLVGKDLIRSAKIKSAVSQIEEYQTALLGFQLRYRGFPGDINNITSQLSTSKWPALANGDGDNWLEDSNGKKFGDSGATILHTGEIAQFWYHLTASGLINDTFSVGSTLGNNFPLSALGRGGIGAFAIYDSGTGSTHNYFHIGLTTSPNPGTDDTLRSVPSLSPKDAWAIDTKMDDGNPTTGETLARGGDTFWSEYYYYYTYFDAPVTDTLFALLGRSVLAPAYAAWVDSEVSDPQDTCAFEDGSGTVTYATSINEANCQLIIRWK